MSIMRGTLFALVTALVSAACVEPRCPKGYNQKGDTCYRIKDAGVGDAGDAGEELDADTSAVVVDAGDAEDDSGSDGPGREMDASAEDASSQLDAGDTEEASTDLCQASGGGSVCDGPVMHLCSAAGITERTETCPNSQQCQDGRALKTCAPCLRGTHQCKEARLERCADNGQRWEFKATCDSVALCNETAGACTDKACTATTRLCDDDTLTGCNAALTALEPIKKCEPGLCDQAQGECDVCVANAKSCEQDTVVSCDVNGRKETRVPCPEETPKCTGSGNCVECVRNSDCTGGHELCTGNKCVVQPYCGDGKVTETIGEECDPKAAEENAWTCSTQCKKTTAYTWCAGKKNAQGDTTSQGCAADEACWGGTCVGRCNVVGDCPFAPIGSVYCLGNICLATGCKAASDCAPGMVCAALPDTPNLSGISSNRSICAPCDDDYPCPTGSCVLAPGDTYKKCVSK